MEDNLPLRVTTEELLRVESDDTPTYVTTYAYSDSLGRVREEQAASPAGGRIVTVTSYDNRGNTIATTLPMHNTSAPGSGLLFPANVTVPSMTLSAFDGLGRPTSQALLSFGVEKWRTTNTHDGDRTTATPPDGGAITREWNVFGQTTAITRHAAKVGESNETSLFGYDRSRDLVSVTDAAGNVTQYGYDLAGRRTSTQDPNSGESTSTYNAAGDLLSTVDGRGTKISTKYDKIGRPLSRWHGDPDTGTKLAEWTYDTIVKGELASSTRWFDNQAYTLTPLGFDGRYRPTGFTWTIPEGEGDLAGSYTYQFAYNAGDRVTAITFPAAGGLPAETVTTGYSPIGYATTLNGTSQYATAGYTNIGQLSTLDIGTGTTLLRRTFTYDDPTGWLKALSAWLPNSGTEPPFVQNDVHTHDKIGNITAIADGTDGGTGTQCFTYDGQSRLTLAITLTACPATPDPAATPTGSLPYRESYSYDAAGNRTTDVVWTPTGDISRTYTYPATGQPRPHAVGSATVAGPSGSRTDTFAYDDAGNTTEQVVAGATTTYTWDQEGRFETATTQTGAGTDITRHIYDADGTQLIRRDPSGSTLYLPGMDVRASGGTVTATRHYTLENTLIASRGPAGWTALSTNHQGSTRIAVDTATGEVDTRHYTPYGDDRSDVTAWPSDRGFLHSPTNQHTDLVHLGAREYHPAEGRFLSPDPLIDLTNTVTYNPYAYSGHNPITFSDPDGLKYSHSDSYGGGSSGSAWRGSGSGNNGGIVGRPPCLYCQASKVSKEAARSIRAFEREMKVIKQRRNQAARQRALQRASKATSKQSTRNARGASSSKSKSNGSRADGNPKPSKSRTKSDGKKASRTTHQSKGCRGAGNSFIPETKVLMGDGTTKAIKDVKVGDKVKATDPKTGKTAVREVTATIIGSGLKRLVTITVDTEPGKPGVQAAQVTATDGHPFWSPQLQLWVPATTLQAGQLLQTSTGTWLQITAIAHHTAIQRVHNLTIHDLHTYHVIGAAAVLVHNLDCEEIGPGWFPRGTGKIPRTGQAPG